MVTKSLTDAQTLPSTVHSKILSPSPNPVTSELGSFTSSISPVPDIKLQVPSPLAPKV